MEVLGWWTLCLAEQTYGSRSSKIQQLLEDTGAMEKIDKKHAQVVQGNFNFAFGFFLENLS